MRRSILPVSINLRNCNSVMPTPVSIAILEYMQLSVLKLITLFLLLSFIKTSKSVTLYSGFVVVFHLLSKTINNDSLEVESQSQG
jgi:hypothetical protein